MTRVTSRSEPLFQSVRVQLWFASTYIIPFSSGSLFAILKNAVRVRFRFDKNSVKPAYKTPVRLPAFNLPNIAPMCHCAVMRIPNHHYNFGVQGDPKVTPYSKIKMVCF